MGTTDADQGMQTPQVSSRRSPPGEAASGELAVPPGSSSSAWEPGTEKEAGPGLG